MNAPTQSLSRGRSPMRVVADMSPEALDALRDALNVGLDGALDYHDDEVVREVEALIEAITERKERGR